MFLISSKQLHASRCSVLSFIGGINNNFGLGLRKLFTREELGVIKFEELRKNALQCFKDSDEIEKTKTRFLGNLHNYRLYELRDNLKNFILIIDNKAEDLQLLKEALRSYQKAFNSQVHNVKDFCFGTPIMRLFYLLNLPDDAIRFYKDPELRNVFEQMQTYKVLLSLLYKNKRYEELLNLYKDIRKTLDLYELFPDVTVNCLAFAACYHLNTPEHFKYAQTLWKETQKIKQLHRSLYLLAGLALKQNSPEFALSLVDISSSYVTIRFIKLMAYTQMGEFNKAYDILNQTIQVYIFHETKKKPSLGRQMVCDLREAVRKSGTDKEIKKMDEILKELESYGLLSDETLEQQLLASFPPMLPRNLFLKMKNKSFKSNEISHLKLNK